MTQFNGRTIYGDANAVSVLALGNPDEPASPAGVYGHQYVVQHGETKTDINFQNGSVKLNGVNGVTSEALLAIVIHRTEHVNRMFPCEENEMAIGFAQSALQSFEARTKNRTARGVEGTYTV